MGVIYMLSIIKRSTQAAILALFITIFLFFFFLTGAHAATVTLAWDRPDGDAVAGYNIYYGPPGTNYKSNPRKTINSPDQTQVDITNLEPGETYAFSATSHDGNGNKSEFSEEITHKVPESEDEEQFTISASAGSGGTIEPAGDTVVSYGGSVSYAIQPDNDYEIADVTVNGSSVGAVGKYTLSNVSANSTITASFKIVDEMESKSDNTSDKNSSDDTSDKPFSDDTSDKPSSDDTSDKPSSDDTSDKFPSDNTSDKPPSDNTSDRTSSGSTNDNKIYTEDETVFLETDAYFPATGSEQVKYHWQIRRFGEKKPFYHIVSDVELASHEVQNKLQSGLKYFWQVGFEDIDSAVVSWFDEKSFIVGESVLNHKMHSVDPGVSISDYQMVSFPYWAADSCSKKVFEPMFEGRDARDFRVLAFDPSIGRDGGYRQLGDFKVIPGRAYWVLARNGLDLSMEGVPVTTSSDIIVPLDYNASNDNGWTMIAVPNNASYHWGDVEVIVHDDDGEILYGPAPRRQLSSDNPYIDRQIWKWTPDIEGKYTAYDSNDFKLRPYKGYWVKVHAENVSLSFPYDMQLSDETFEDDGSEFLQKNNDQEKNENLQKRTLDDAHRQYDNGDEPPMPLQGIGGSNEDSNSSGCFIGTLSKSSK